MEFGVRLPQLARSVDRHNLIEWAEEAKRLGIRPAWVGAPGRLDALRAFMSDIAPSFSV